MSLKKKDQASPEDRKALDQLDKRLDALEASRERKPSFGTRSPKGLKGAGQGMKMATDMVAAVGVGLFIGWGLDWFFGTLPLFFLIFFVLGCAAGILNVFRTAKGLEGGFDENRRLRHEKDRKMRHENPAALDDEYDD